MKWLTIRKLVEIILILLAAVLVASCGSRNKTAPSATPGIGTGTPVQSFADLTTQTALSGNVPVVTQPAGLTCYLIGARDWPLKVLERNGRSTDPGHGPYTILDTAGNVRKNAQDWGYIGEVYPGEKLCVGTAGSLPQPTSTPIPVQTLPPTPTMVIASSLVPSPTPTLVGTPQIAGTSFAVIPGTSIPTSTPAPPGKGGGFFSPRLIGILILLLVAGGWFVSRRLRRHQ